MLKQKYGVTTEFDIVYFNTYHTSRTYRKMQSVNHHKAVVIINIGTNDVRFKVTQPHDYRSQKNPHHLIQKMIELLLTQTKEDNIVLVECALLYATFAATTAPLHLTRPPPPPPAPSDP